MFSNLYFTSIPWKYHAMKTCWDDDRVRWENFLLFLVHVFIINTTTLFTYKYNTPQQHIAEREIECWPRSVACGSCGRDIYTFTLYVYVSTIPYTIASSENKFSLTVKSRTPLVEGFELYVSRYINTEHVKCTYER